MSRVESNFLQVVVVFFVVGASEEAEPVRDDG
jgi:hypothetical protein